LTRWRPGPLSWAVVALLIASLAPVPQNIHAQPPKSAADDGGGAHVLLTPHGHRNPHAGVAQQGAPTGAASANDLSYHGGKVMRNPTNYVIIWNPPGSTFGGNYQQLIEQYFTDDGGTPFMSIETQWNDSTGVPVPNTNHFGATWVDTTNAYPHAGTVADPLVGQDIRDEVNRAIAANPTWQAPGYSTMYFVYLGENIIECFKGSGNTFGCFAGTDVNGNSPPAASGNPNTVAGAGTYCAYHSSDGANIYATLPYASLGACYGSPTTFPNGVDQDIVLSPTSHEQNEAYSDPNLDAWYNDASGNENGDNCAYTYGQVEPDGTNFVLSGHRYQIQREWSNAFPDGCIKRLGPASQLIVTGDLSFGTIPRGTAASKNVLIQNTASGDLNLLNVRFGPGAPAQFSIDPSSPTWATLPIGESVLVKVNFAPSATTTATGPLTTSLIVDTDQPGQETQSFAASASIGQPKAVLSPSSLDFGIVCPSSFFDQQITVTNTGQAPLTISNVAIGGGSTPGLSVQSPPSLPQTLPIGAHLSFTIRFTPTSTTPSTITGTVVVTTNDPNNPTLSIPIGGSIGAPSATIGSSALDFGGVATDNRTSPYFVDKTLTIGNTGTCSLSLTSLTIGGTNAGDFSIVGAPTLPVSIGTASSLTLTVRFNPSAAGLRVGTLSVSTSDPAHPSLAVALTGTGLLPAVQTSADALTYAPTVIQSQAPGYPGVTQGLTVTNVGQAELIVDSMTTSGAPYAAPAATVPPARYATSDGFSEPITFAPTAAGKFSGTFNVADNDPEGVVAKSVSLCGEGVLRGIRVLAVDVHGTPIAQIAKLHLQSKGTAQGVNINTQNLALTGVPTSCDASAQEQYENQGLPATDTANQRSSYYTLAVTAGGKSTTITFSLGVSEFKTLVVTVK
jgi:hypothetical protein